MTRNPDVWVYQVRFLTYDLQSGISSVFLGRIVIELIIAESLNKAYSLEVGFYLLMCSSSNGRKTGISDSRLRSVDPLLILNEWQIAESVIVNPVKGVISPHRQDAPVLY